MYSLSYTDPSSEFLNVLFKLEWVSIEIRKQGGGALRGAQGSINIKAERWDIV